MAMVGIDDLSLGCTVGKNVLHYANNMLKLEQLGCGEHDVDDRKFGARASKPQCHSGTVSRQLMCKLL